ncbi:putative DNA binding domain-containing protein [candidate division KSB1 bacterium]|nr:putative DNA binding domain-containing protein [candidate division KSB1 bacterium]
MKPIEILDLIAAGETTTVQFKEKIEHPDKLTSEMVAFSNSKGGLLLIGVREKTGQLLGLSPKQIREISELAGNLASNNILSPIFIETQVVTIDEVDGKKNILVIEVKEGLNKPHKDRNGTIWIKQGSDKRKLTDNYEIMRLFQSGGNLLADEMPVPATSIFDVDREKVSRYLKKIFNRDIEAFGIPYKQLLINKNILKDDRVTLGGLLFFGIEPQRYKPAFCVKAVNFWGNDLSGTQYRDSEDLLGDIPTLFSNGLAFIKRNLRKVQAGQNFNSQGRLEISEIALEELLQNALVHRDYFKNAPIRILIFDNRVEIVSPGKLPNNLTVDNIRFGNTVIRNNLLATFCSQIMVYRGLGSGIIRALNEQPNIELINDEAGEQFIVKISRIDT